MDFTYKELINYASYLYDIKVSISYLQNNILFLHTPFDDFKIYLQDKKRFGYFTIAHKNHKQDKKYWHTQLKCNTLDYAIYICLVHGFNKIYNLWSSQEDYERFLADAKRYNNDIENNEME